MEKLSLKDVLQSFIIALVVAFTGISLFRVTTTIGSSMENTLHEGEHHIIALIKRPIKGSIIVVDKTEELDMMIIKRVIATEGDHLQIDHGKVYINDELLEESYIKEPEFEPDKLDLEIPKNKVFVMGDNRNNSIDSRSDMIGLIDKREIKGILIRSLPVWSQILIYISGIAIITIAGYVTCIILGFFRTEPEESET